jgi:hypothetical protein
MLSVLPEAVAGRGGDYRGNAGASSVIAGFTIKLPHFAPGALVGATFGPGHLQSIHADTLDRGLSFLHGTFVLDVTRLSFRRRAAALWQAADNDIVLHSISQNQQPVAGGHSRARFGAVAVDPDVSTIDRSSRLRTRFVKARVA